MDSIAGSSLLCVWIFIIANVADGRRTLLQTTFGKSFPNYPCQTDSTLSPFKLEDSYTTSPSANGVRICFTGGPIQRCPPTDPCCSKSDFYKLELRVRPTCNRAIRSVTVNGLPAPLPTFETYGLARDMALFKLPRLNLTTANVTGAKICITLRDPCPNLAALCPEGDGSCTYSIGQSTQHHCCPVNRLGLNTPSIPNMPTIPTVPPPRKPAAVHGPPSPGTPPGGRKPAPYAGTFPFNNNCNTTTGLLSFGLAGAPTFSRSSSGNNMYCFSLTSSACLDPASPCCDSNLLKVDWWSYDTCRGSVKAYIDKTSYPVTWDKGGTFRLTKLNYTRDSVAAKPRQMCIELRRDGPCSTIDKFCRGDRCMYALYDTAVTCCPTAYTPLSSR